MRAAALTAGTMDCLTAPLTTQADLKALPSVFDWVHALVEAALLATTVVVALALATPCEQLLRARAPSGRRRRRGRGNRTAALTTFADDRLAVAGSASALFPALPLSRILIAPEEAARLCTAVVVADAWLAVAERLLRALTDPRRVGGRWCRRWRRLGRRRRRGRWRWYGAAALAIAPEGRHASPLPAGAHPHALAGSRTDASIVAAGLPAAVVVANARIAVEKCLLWTLTVAWWPRWWRWRRSWWRRRRRRR